MTGEPKRILVVDDEEEVRSLVSRVLSEAGHAVEVASGGEEALQKIRAARPHLLVLDLIMPGMDGWTLLEELREGADPPPVVILTARGDASTFTRGVRQGVSAFVFKPFRFHELIGTCDRVLRYTAKKMPPAGGERRGQWRRVVVVEVSVVSEGQTRSATGKLLNLSVGGAQVELDAPLEPGNRARIGFSTPAGESLLSLEAQVQWRHAVSRGFAHGLVFEGLAPEIAARLRELLGRPPFEPRR